jgi:hypothetical protein
MKRVSSTSAKKKHSATSKVAEKQGEDKKTSRSERVMIRGNDSSSDSNQRAEFEKNYGAFLEVKKKEFTEDRIKYSDDRDYLQVIDSHEMYYEDEFKEEMFLLWLKDAAATAKAALLEAEAARLKKRRDAGLKGAATTKKSASERKKRFCEIYLEERGEKSRGKYLYLKAAVIKVAMKRFRRSHGSICMRTAWDYTEGLE